MALKKLAKDHPVFVIAGALVAMIGAIVSVLSLIEPKYKRVTDEVVCGYSEDLEMVREHQWNECENPNNVIGYRFSETVSKSSGRVGGGYDQQWHCTNVKREKEKAIGEAVIWTDQTSSEESSRNWKGEVTYKYHCSIKARWGPIYARERWSGCGEAPLTAQTMRRAKTCFDHTQRVGWKWKWE